MVTMTVMYPFDAEKPFDEAYFHATHLPLVKEVWGDAVTGITCHHGVAGLGAEHPAFSTMVQIEFASMEAFQQAMGHPRAAEVNGDVPNYSAIAPTVQLSRAA